MHIEVKAKLICHEKVYYKLSYNFMLRYWF